MNQTIKYGKLRAKNDPDRDVTNHGLYYGHNLCKWPINWALSRTTRGTFVKRGSN